MPLRPQAGGRDQVEYSLGVRLIVTVLTTAVVAPDFFSAAVPNV
jgi:hypothetical protein